MFAAQTFAVHVTLVFSKFVENNAFYSKDALNWSKHYSTLHYSKCINNVK